MFFAAASTYAGILGPEGMAVYRKLAEAEWAKVPARTATSPEQGWRSHFAITRIMEELAQISGDTKALVAVMSRDLSHAYSYLKIAELYQKSGDQDEALRWAEKGLEAFPERTDSRLREFAAQQYHRRGRHDEAMKLIWAEFADRPGVPTYATLEEHAKKAGAWEHWRDRALGLIRQRIEAAREKNRGKSAWMQLPADHSALVEIFLYERQAQTAWEEAQRGGCSDALWRRLADERAKDHPEDAAPIYLRYAAAALKTARKSNYTEAVKLLIDAAAAMKQMGRSEEFVRHLQALRLEHKARRNFIALLEEKQGLLYLA